MIELFAEIDAQPTELGNLVEDFGSRFISRLAKEAPAEMRDLMTSATASGRTYERGKGAGFAHSHRASATGEPPAIDTGEGIRSLKGERSGNLEAEIEMKWYLEYLDRKLGRTFIEPAIETAINKTLQSL